MEAIEQENLQLREQVATLQSTVDRLTTLLKAQNQAPLPPLPSQALTSTVLETYNFNESFHPNVSGIRIPTLTVPQVTMSIPPPEMTVPVPVVHTTLHKNEPVGQAENVEAHLVNDFQDQFDEMRCELRALRGKDLFGKSVHELCLVPNVKIPPKFKVPEFEKYKGNSCPQIHLVMYTRKMCALTKDDRLLIHFFQDSLTGVALKWYMSLNKANIKTFSDLCEAFNRQYKYNVDMAPDRDQLRAMAQKDNETFKEYAERWRGVAAQISPPLEEKEMTKIFLKTLDTFYYDRMVSNAFHDFSDLVDTGMHIEEALREGRLTKETAFFSDTKEFGLGFDTKKEQELSMVAHGKPKKNKQQHVVAINSTPKGVPQYDPIPMLYADLFPILIERDLIQTRATPRVPTKMPYWYKPELTCAFHQGAPGHDIEQCFALKSEVQKLIETNKLSFEDVDPALLCMDMV